MTTSPDSPPAPTDFIREIVARDLQAGTYEQSVTRFPPEPNGYLHIGHAKSICLNFGIAREFGGRCNLRMDDTNPAKEEVEYVDSIIADVRWLICGWADQQLTFKADEEPFYASDYFPQLYEFAQELIRRGKAYVDELTPEETDRFRQESRDSPHRERPAAESLELLARMKAGEFADGTLTLRAKIDMQAPNVWLRDPVLYRIRHTEHHHTGTAWCIYPMYDFAHCLSDYLEGVTHSVCTLEFEVHRPLYDWILQSLELPRALPHQYEFARLNLSFTLMSKRKLLQLVQEGLVTGWDDPRMPTISGLRRRGVPADALRDFAYHIGITKYDGVTDVAVLEHAIRGVLNRRALRRLAVLHPLKVVLTNFPAERQETSRAVNNPEDESAGAREIAFGRELYIEREDFMEEAAPKFFRLKPGGEVRLKYGYIIRCDEVIKDEAGNVVELRCTADLESKTGGPNAGRKVKGTIHWVNAAEAVEAEVRLYDRLFTEAEPEQYGDFKKSLNPHSLTTVTAKLEPSLRDADPSLRYQFERLGYFTLDRESTAERLVFNRTITLKDAWAKETRKG